MLRRHPTRGLPQAVREVLLWEIGSPVVPLSAAGKAGGTRERILAGGRWDSTTRVRARYQLTEACCAAQNDPSSLRDHPQGNETDGRAVEQAKNVLNGREIRFRHDRY